MSVGHVARAIESAGTPTVSVYIGAFAHYADAMRVPRTVVTGHLMGRPLGHPGDGEGQRAVLQAAFDLAASATGNGAVVRTDS